MKSAFTLIELLVVVLIIAVLAAVALPQYNKTVKKARAAEAIQALDVLDKAIHNYYLTHGTYEGLSGDTLDITIPQSSALQYGSQHSTRTSQFRGCDPNKRNVVGEQWTEQNYCAFDICINAAKAPCIAFGQEKGKTRAWCTNDNEDWHGCEKYFFGTITEQQTGSMTYEVFNPLL